jgi:O-antigen/teichoic acid export membrane protein
MPITGNKLLLDGVWVLLGKAVSMLSGLLVIAIITRLLSSGEVGFYFLCFSLVTILSVISQLGLNLAVVRLIAESLSSGRHEHAASVAVLVLRIGAIAVIVISCLALFFSYMHPPGIFERFSVDLPVLAIILVWFSFITMQGLISECLRGYHDVRSAALYGGMLPSMLSVTALFVVWASVDKSSIEMIIGILSGAVFTSAVFGAVRLRRKMRLDRKTEKIDLTGLLSIAWPMWTSNITVLLLTQADIWIIGSFLSVDDVAIYGSAARLVVVVSISLMIVNSVVSPVVADLFYRDKHGRLEDIIRTGATLAAVPSLLAVLLFSFFGGQLLGILYGPFYSSGYVILFVLSLGQLFNVVSGPCGMVLLMTGHQRIMMAISISTSTMAIVASVFAAIHTGAIGVAAVFSAAIVVQNMLMIYFVRRRVGISTFMNFRLAFPSV